MQKRVTIITIVLTVIVFLGTILGVYLLTIGSFNKKSGELKTSISTAQAELDAIKASKDTNGFTPTEVVKYFFDEVKSGSTAKAKLYLGPEAQEMDISATLKLGSDFAGVNTGEYLEETVGDNVNVNMTFILASEETTVRVFELTKYDDAWKIIGVTAE